MEKAKNLTILLNAEDLVKLQVLQRKMCNTATGVIRYLINEWHEKNFAQNNTTVLTPAPSAPSAPAARHVPTVDEVLAMRKPEASEACWEFWGDWTEEQRRALIGPLEITRSVLDERFGLSPDDEPYGDD